MTKVLLGFYQDLRGIVARIGTRILLRFYNDDTRMCRARLLRFYQDANKLLAGGAYQDFTSILLGYRGASTREPRCKSLGRGASLSAVDIGP